MFDINFGIKLLHPRPQYAGYLAAILKSRFASVPQYCDDDQRDLRRYGYRMRAGWRAAYSATLRHFVDRG